MLVYLYRWQVRMCSEISLYHQYVGQMKHSHLIESCKNGTDIDKYIYKMKDLASSNRIFKIASFGMKKCNKLSN
jgi:hypothetical protein